MTVEIIDRFSCVDWPLGLVLIFLLLWTAATVLVVLLLTGRSR